MKRTTDATVFNAPLAESEPFLLTQCGISSKSRPMHHMRLQSDISCIQYVISGSGVINIGGKVYTAGPGDTFLLLEGTDQNYYSYNADHWECLWINFKGELSSALLNTYRLHETVVFHNADTFPILMEMYDAIQTVAEPNAYVEKTSRLFFDLVYCLSVTQPKETQELDPPDFVRCYLDSHLADDVRLADVAAATHQSVEHIIRGFKNTYGITPYRYLLESRMRLARIMLANSKKTIGEIAAELGFYDAHHFSSRFEKMHGCRPSVYRQQHKT